MHLREDGVPHLITPDELARSIDDPEGAPFILDVRAPDQFERWQIEGKAKPSTVNIPYWTAILEEEQVKAAVPDDRDVVVVCAHGDSSDLVVETVGMPNMRNLDGGMDAWATTLVRHTLLDDPPGVTLAPLGHPSKHLPVKKINKNH